jgi:hypothetical protein
MKLNKKPVLAIQKIWYAGTGILIHKIILDEKFIIYHLSLDFSPWFHPAFLLNI